MKFYTRAGMAELFKTDESSIMALAMTGDIPEPHFIGNRLVRWTEADLDRWAADNCKANKPTIFENDWRQLRREFRREQLEKHAVEEKLGRAVACPFATCSPS